MKNRNYIRLIVGVLGFASVLAVAVILWIVLATNNLPESQVAARAATVGVTSTPVLPTPTVPAKPTPTLAAGEEINLPFSKRVDIKVVKASFPPPISKETALKALRYRQNAVGLWDLDKSTAEGKPITVTAVFGLVTEGRPGPSGWSGMRNIGGVNCQLEGECTLTGQVLDHLEDRPMWVIDIEGVYQPFAGDPSIPNNHVVYGIDVQTLERIGFGPYKS